MDTTKLKQIDLEVINKKWLIVDASGQALGRVASQIAHILRGKHKPTYTRNWDCGDNVVVINAEKIKLTGNKMRDKFYHSHSSYIGGIKSVRAEDMMKSFPERLIKLAVKGMIPNSVLGRQALGNMKVYAGSEHPHVAQKPVAMGPRVAGRK